MRRLTILLTLATALLLTSCGRTVFEEVHQLPDETWLRLDHPEEFTFNINNIESCYNIDVMVKLDTTKYTERILPLVVNFDNDNGEQRMFYSQIALRDKEGKLAGPTEGPYVTVRTHLKEYFYFNFKGKNHMSIKQGTSKYQIRGIAEFGLIVEKVNLKVK